MPLSRTRRLVLFSLVRSFELTIVKEILIYLVSYYICYCVGGRFSWSVNAISSNVCWFLRWMVSVWLFLPSSFVVCQMLTLLAYPIKTRRLWSTKPVVICVRNTTWKTQTFRRALVYRSSRIWECALLHISSSALTTDMNSSLALINTVCLLFLNRKVLGSHLNKPARSIFEAIWKQSKVRLWDRERGKWGGGGGGGCVRLQMSHLICCKVMKCRYLPLKNMCPADMCEIYVSFFPLSSNPIFKNSIGLQQKVWNILIPPPKEYSGRWSLQVKNVYANAGYIRACTGC